MAKNQIVSIDIGASAIKLVQLEQTAAGIHLVNAGIEAYPYTTPTTEIPTEVISETLQRLWRHVIGRSPTVVLSIPRLSVTSRRLTNLPAGATDDQLSDLVAMQAETELPFRVESAIYDHHDAHRSEDGISIELIAARRETVQQQIDYLKPVGITPKGVMPSALATSVLAGLTSHGDAALTEMTMVVDIGAGRTDLCLIAGDALRFSRSFPIGGNHLTHLYQRETGDNFEVAERRKIVNAGLNPQLEGTEPSHEWAEGLVAELRRSINGAKRELNISEDKIVSEIWLCGGGARISGLTDYITDRLEVPVLLWNPLDAFKEVWDEQRSDTQSVDSFSDTLAVALGLGVNALTSADFLGPSSLRREGQTDTSSTAEADANGCCSWIGSASRAWARWVDTEQNPSGENCCSGWSDQKHQSSRIQCKKNTDQRFSTRESFSASRFSARYSA